MKKQLKDPCFSCDREEQKYITGLCEGCHEIAMNASGFTADGKPLPEHNLELGYSTSDDGVWLSCSCGYQENLGFCASPYTAVEVANKHFVRQVNSNNQPTKSTKPQ